jgi:hypothetical protein
MWEFACLCAFALVIGVYLGMWLQRSLAEEYYKDGYAAGKLDAETEKLRRLPGTYRKSRDE